MVTQSNHSHLELVKARQRTGWLWAATFVLSLAFAFFNIYFVYLERAMVKRSSVGFVKWPLPPYVTDKFVQTIACGTAFLGVVVFILWLVALSSLKHCPTLADVERHRG